MKSLFVVTSDVEFEPVVAIVASFMNQKAFAICKKPSEMENVDIHGYRNGDYVFCLGDKLTFDSRIPNEKIFRISFEQGVAPIRCLISTMGDLGFISLHAPMVSNFLRKHNDFINLVDDRIRSIDNYKTQDFVAGLYNYMSNTLDNGPCGLCNKIYSILSDESTFEAIRADGRALLSSQV